MVLASVSAPAMAQDASSIEAYAGPIIGWDHVRVSEDGDSGSKDGFVYGGVIGAQTRIGGSGVLGIEGEVDGATTKETGHDVLSLGDTLSLKAGRDFFIGARAGIMVTPKTLFYVKGGYTNARFTARYDDGAGNVGSGSENLDGYRIGGGVEYMIGRVRLRGEYRFSDYGKIALDGVDTGLSSQRHQIVVGATYAF
jgi:outer membrane immunogenic protein